jgi:hypothetical protein
MMAFMRGSLARETIWDMVVSVFLDHGIRAADFVLTLADGAAPWPVPEAKFTIGYDGSLENL